MNKHIVKDLVGGLAVYGACNIVYNLGKKKGIKYGIAIGKIKGYADMRNDIEKHFKLKPKHSKTEL